MKKVVVSILIILPLFLIVVISLLGQVYSDFNFVKVERVEVYDQNDNLLGKDKVFRIQKGDEVPLRVRVLPELATNKKFSFISSRDDVCSVLTSDEGVKVIGRGYGDALLTVTTENGNKTAVVRVVVSDDYVSGVKFSLEEIKLGVGEEKNLASDVLVLPETALDKRVSWYVPDEYKGILRVDSNGTISGLAEGEGYVTVKTTDGGFEARCRVIVIGGAPLYFEKPAGMQDLWTVSEKVFELGSYLRINVEGVTRDDVIFEIESGGKRATIDEKTGSVTFKEKGIVIVKAYVGDKNNPDYFVTVSLVYSAKKD